jgi:3-dehydroquinate dehydratase/shikimate dehydrogenase
LLKLAQSKGLGTISGTEMFVHQAARQFEIWTGKPAPIDGMRQVLLRQLGAVGVENSAPIPTVVQPKAKAVAANAITSVSDEAEASSETAAAPKGNGASPVKTQPKAETKTDAKLETKAGKKAAESKVATKEAVKNSVKTADASSAKAASVKAKALPQTKPALKTESKKLAAKPVAKKATAKAVKKKR